VILPLAWAVRAWATFFGSGGRHGALGTPDQCLCLGSTGRTSVCRQWMRTGRFTVERVGRLRTSLPSCRHLELRGRWSKKWPWGWWGYGLFSYRLVSCVWATMSTRP